jgi:hypothetical protein
VNEDDINAAPVKSAPAPLNAPIQKIEARARPNPRWGSHHLHRLLTVPIRPLFGPDDVVFTIGSCFAERIRIALVEQGVKVGPPFGQIPMNDDRYRIDNLPRRPHMNYYNSFTIRQEFERHVGAWTQAKDDFWRLDKPKIWDGVAFQDPYRRMVLGRTPEDLSRAVSLIDAAMDRGIREANVFFITLGMAEVFRNKASGMIACQKPGYGGGAGEDETEFVMSTYEENYANMTRVVEIIGDVCPSARIVVSVSPVGLSRTFGDQDILAANTEGKSILRAVLGALARKHENVTYFPSYEIVMANAPLSFREDDGRHVANWVVSRIVRAFKEAHFVETGALTRTAAE